MAHATAVLHDRSSLRVIIGLLLILACVPSTPAFADDVRVERGYHKGKPIRIRLVTIGWAEVELATARAFRKMEAAAARDGIALSIRSGFRSHERQQWLYQAWKEGWGNKAARPGYSNHEAGRALDLRIDDDVLAWLRTHAKRYGFHATVRGEPWHWEYKPKPERKRRAIARGSSKRRRS